MRSFDDECPLAHLLAERVRANRATLTQRWLDRIAARSSIDRDTVFPTDVVLGHVSLLMDGIAAFVENPSIKMGPDVAIVAKARDLGALRHHRGFDANEILREYEMLGSVLFSFAVEEVESREWTGTNQELL